MWDVARRREYLDWAAAVVANCPRVNAALEARFAEVLEEGRQKLGV
jgi:guanosine-3',5'-bis(diphosphate) 3'-pyrophosphohydrolase